MDIRKACGSQWKAGAYITYAYHKGWVKVAERKSNSPNSPVIFERINDFS